jgi:ribosome-associated translation inhibitor RaiA
MQLRIRPRRVEIPDEVRAAIDRRLRLAVGRHAAAVLRAEATFSPLAPRLAAAPRASCAPGAATRCRIRLRLRDGATLAVDDHGPDPAAAAAAAAWRLEHRLDRPRGVAIRGRTAGRSG